MMSYFDKSCTPIVRYEHVRVTDGLTILVYFHINEHTYIGVIDARSLQIKDYTFSLSSSGGCSTDKLSATGYTFDIAVSMWKPLQN